LEAVVTTRRSILSALSIALVATISLLGISAPVSAADGTSTTPESALSPSIIDHGDDGVGVPDSAFPDTTLGRKAKKARTAAGTTAAIAAQVHTIWISVASIVDSSKAAVTVPTTEAAARSFVSQLNSYWNRESGGKVSLAFGGFETRALDATCDLRSIYDKSPTVAFSGAFKNYKWIGSNKHLLTLSTRACGSGLGSIGGSGGLLASGLGSGASLGLPTAVHEFGHNLGFSHGNASICATASYDASASAFSTSCLTGEYADFLDIMGFTVADSAPHLSSPQRIRSGYMTDYSALSGGSTTTTIKPLGSNGSSGIRALQVTDPDGEIYYVEYRVADSVDAGSAEFLWPTACDNPFRTYQRCYMDTEGSIGGVRIMRAIASTASSSFETRVLAVGPLAGSASLTQRDTHLDAGESFTNYDDDLTITVNSVNATAGASVTVAFGPHTVTTAPPTTTPTTTPAPAPAPAPTPTTTSAPPTAVTSDTSPTVVPQVVNTPSIEPLAEKSKISTRVSISLPKKTVKKTDRGKVTVKVSYRSHAAPRGTLVVYANNKKLGSYKLTAKAQGKVTISLPKLRKTGKYSITVRYTGNTAFTASTSSAKKLTAR
jgi:hypothetical protein